MIFEVLRQSFAFVQAFFDFGVGDIASNDHRAGK
jgi:hypothetical protein